MLTQLFVICSFAGLAPRGLPNLTFVAGDEIEVVSRSDPEWWEVSCGDRPSCHSISLALILH